MKLFLFKVSFRFWFVNCYVFVSWRREGWRQFYNFCRQYLNMDFGMGNVLTHANTNVMSIFVWQLVTCRRWNQWPSRDGNKVEPRTRGVLSLLELFFECQTVFRLPRDFCPVKSLISFLCDFFRICVSMKFKKWIKTGNLQTFKNTLLIEGNFIKQSLSS